MCTTNGLWGLSGWLLIPYLPGVLFRLRSTYCLYSLPMYVLKRPNLSTKSITNDILYALSALGKKDHSST